MPDPATLAYYAAHATERADRYEAADVRALHERWLAACPPGGTALDVGCGSGRDVAFLAAAGRDATGVDPSAAMLAEARRRHPAMAARLCADGLPDLAALADRRFDAVGATAVLVHVAPAELAPAMARLAALVAPGGALLLSIPEPSLAPDPDADPAVRRFFLHDPATVRALAERAGLHATADALDPDGAGRRRRWRVLAFRRG